ncbi:MAG TPA: acyltransferase [Herbaspirillum sp.]|jgi:peptidoglycan/LPS O-acetylase OafA/YrhL
MQTNSRIPCIDALKAVACLFIVSHHLAFYGPMSDTARPLMPGLIDWMYQNGRLAVQVFFVTAGFLLAGKLAPDGVVHLTQPLQTIKRRFMRLAVPYWFALVVAIVCAAMVIGRLTRYEVPVFPTLPQLLANIVMLQDLLHEGALSAGVWYVAIDFQLFTVTAILLWACGLAARRHAGLALLPPLAVLAICLLSLFVFNRNESLDNTWLYFFGSYGLGILAYWVAKRPRGLLWLTLLVGMVAIALLLEFRSRIALAGLVMLLLGLARRYPAIGQRSMGNALSYLGRISYAVFLTHYPLCLLVNAVFFIYFPQSAAMNVLGMAVAVIVSVAGGALFFRYIENGSLVRAFFSGPAARAAP